jgi:hypothetical protein
MFNHNNDNTLLMVYISFKLELTTIHRISFYQETSLSTVTV